MNKIFIEEFTNDILPLYEKHEKTFDIYGIHGRLHISRSIIFAKYMSKYYSNLDKNLDFDAIKYAISFHDSGRQANGVDFWEKDSEKICLFYLYNKGYDIKYCKYISSLIIKDDNSDINKNIVQDADVLEIMRPICGHGGRLGFNKKYLKYSGSDRNFLIEDAWTLIKYTENNPQLFKNNNHLYKLIDIISENKIGLNLITINEF
jgi:hypothetical protein